MNIKRYLARADNAECLFEVEAETLSEAREILEMEGFNGFLYESEYQLVCTTPHIIGEVE